MKRQILSGLTVMLICFLIGGSYIIYAISNATKQLESALIMHRTQDAVERLGYGIDKVQTALRQNRFPQKKHLTLLQTDVSGLKNAIEECFSCQFSRQLIASLNELDTINRQYLTSLNQLLQMSSADSADRETLLTGLAAQGRELYATIDTLNSNIDEEVPGRSENLYHDITKVKQLIIFLVVVGPIVVLAVTASFFKRFTGSIGVLTQAVETLKSGDLNYRIDSDLKYEFRNLANSFNAMVASLKLQKEHLDTARLLYQTLFESAGEGIFLLDLSEHHKGRIMTANPAAAKIHGYEEGEMVGMNIAEISSDDECPERLQCALQGQWMGYVVQRKRKNGSLFLAEVNLGLLEMQEQKYAIVFTHDITQKKKEEAELQRANQMALVGEMAAGLAHEIKNPLAGIKVSLEVLADELELSREDQELFARVIKETDRMEKLLKGLLNYARPPQLQCERFDLHKLLDNTIKNLSLRSKTAAGQEVVFNKNYAADIPAVEADSAQLQQVFLNILLNALEAMPQGGRLEVTTERSTPDQLAISIRDSGNGIPPNTLANIFQPFITTKTRGTGLGLAISKRIIEEHSGSITATNGADGGAIFSITLPFKHTAQEASL